MSEDWTREREAVMATFAAMLAQVTGDGSKKRQSGEKPPWWRDGSHEAAMYRHLEAYESGERYDPDSGADPLVGVAWRALAIAYQRGHGKVNPYETV